MKKIAIALTMLTALALPLVAQETGKPAKKPAVPNASTSPTEGRIGFVSQNKVTVKPKGAEAGTAFKLDAETKVTVNGEAKSVSDLKKGWMAKVTPKVADLETAATIEVTKKEGGPVKEPKPEANE
ncbi:MAG: hypothetical protein EBV83_00370 [Verrucomicrobia bacterium]|nr:hypothetical protein [Verrucomicrobiota bacterium]